MSAVTYAVIFAVSWVDSEDMVVQASRSYTVSGGMELL